MKGNIILAILLIFSSGRSQTRYVTTIHPFQEIMKSVVKNRGEVYRILPPGASPHTYELRPSDIRKVETAAALILGGKNLDEWAFKFQHPNRIELLNLIPADYLLHLEFESQDEHQHAKHEKVVASQHHHHRGGIDPHFWTDPLAVKALLPPLVEKLCLIDKEGAETYKKNTAKFSTYLDSLFTVINKKLKPIQGKAVMLSHPFFRYFFNRFGIELVGIVEINPGKEPTPKDIKEMIGLVKDNKVRAIFTHPQLPDRAAQLVAEATGAKVYQLDPIGGVPGRQSYDELLLYNVQVLLEALR